MILEGEHSLEEKLQASVCGTPKPAEDTPEVAEAGGETGEGG